MAGRAATAVSVEASAEVGTAAAERGMEATGADSAEAAQLADG